MIRVGQVVNLQPDHIQKVESERYQLMGFVLILSIYLPHHFRQRLGLALYNFQIMLLNRPKITPHYSMGFAKAVSPDAEIFKCARAGLTENVKCLLHLRKASAKDITIFGTTLLHSASKSGNMELVRLLIQEGADVNAQDEDGESPLHGALARSNNYNIARILIENGADLSIRAVDGKTPLHNIFNNTISQVLMKDDWLEKIVPDSEAMSITHFLEWSSISSPEILQRGHLYDDADLLSADILGRTCLHFAACRGNLGVLSYLIKEVSAEDVNKKDVEGRSPLHYAVQTSRAAEVIEILMGKGCNIYATDENGRTALHWAARWNNFNAVKKLMAIADGEILLLPDKNGRTPSAEVSQRRAPALYEYLKDLESSSGLRVKQSITTRLQRRRASYCASLDFSLFLETVGIVILIFIILLGISD